MAVFHKYSFRNTMLILHQLPNASHIAGFNAWKDLNRYVKEGEKAIKIFAPAPYKTKIDEIQRDGNGEIIRDGDGNPVTKEVALAWVFVPLMAHTTPVVGLTTSQMEWA